MIITSLANSQGIMDKFLKQTYTQILIDYKPKNGGTINTFDVDGKFTDWPILYQPNSDENVEDLWQNINLLHSKHIILWPNHSLKRPSQNVLVQQKISIAFPVKKKILTNMLLLFFQ